MANTKITTNVIADDAITAAKIADDAVGSDQIADDAITTAKLANSINTDITAKLPLAGGTLTGNLLFADSVRARFGADNDLQIFHDTSNSYIENTGTGDLILQDSGGDVRIKGKSNEDSIVANNDGSVELYYDNAKKFETTSAGVSITGTLAVGLITGTTATASGSTNTTALASTAFVQQELTTLIGGAPSTLNDLNELAAAINDDANYNSTLTTALATKLPLAGGILTGDLSIPNKLLHAGDGDTSIDFDTNLVDVYAGGVLGIRVLPGAIVFNEASGDVDFRVESTDNDNMLFVDGGNNRVGIGKAAASQPFEVGVFSVFDTGVVINEGGNDSNFRVESDDNANMLFVDGGEDRVGIGTASPGYLLDLLTSSGNTVVNIKSTTGGDPELQFDSAASSRNGVIRFLDQGSAAGKIIYAHNGDTMSFHRANESVASLILKDGNVGIGTASPSGMLHIQEGSNYGAVDSGADQLVVSNNGAESGITIAATTVATINFADAAGSRIGRVRYEHDNNKMEFWANDAERMSIDSAGNVGIGITAPSAWHTDHRSIQLGAGGSGVSGGGATYRNVSLNQNTYLNASGDWKYFGTDYAAKIEAYDGAWSFKVAASGTADATVSFTEALTILNSGNVGISQPSPAHPLHVGDDSGGSSNDTIAFIQGSSTGENNLFLGKSLDQNNATVLGFKYASDGSASNYGYWMNWGEAPGSGLVMADGGKVGIGTTAPVEALTLANSTGLGWINSNSYTHGIFKETNDLKFRRTSGTTANSIASGDVSLTILGATGNVGIGLTNPADGKLMVAGVLAGDYGISVQNSQATPGVYINQDGNSNALNIDAESTTTEAIYVSADVLTTGAVAYFVSNSESTAGRELVLIVNDNPLATGTIPLEVQQHSSHLTAMFQNTLAGTDAEVQIRSSANDTDSVLSLVQGNGAGMKVMYDGGTDEFQIKESSTVHFKIYSGGAATFYGATNNFQSGTIQMGGTEVIDNSRNITAASIALGGTGAANTLDDYEEGTFTPTWTVAGGGTMNGVTATNHGTYTKVGRICTISFYSVYVSTSGTAPTYYILQVPFAAAANSVATGVGREFAQGSPLWRAEMGLNATTITFKEFDETAPAPNGYIQGSFTYQTV